MSVVPHLLSASDARLPHIHLVRMVPL